MTTRSFILSVAAAFFLVGLVSGIARGMYITFF
jgi:hypothetical protein